MLIKNIFHCDRKVPLKKANQKTLIMSTSRRIMVQFMVMYSIRTIRAERTRDKRLITLMISLVLGILIIKKMFGRPYVNI